jgi:hypothetical protein
VCVFITAVPIIKLFAWGEGDSGGHVLRETTSRGLCGLCFVADLAEKLVLSSHHQLADAGLAFLHQCVDDRTQPRVLRVKDFT